MESRNEVHDSVDALFEGYDGEDSFYVTPDLGSVAHDLYQTCPELGGQAEPSGPSVEETSTTDAGSGSPLYPPLPDLPLLTEQEILLQTEVNAVDFLDPLPGNHTQSDHISTAPLREPTTEENFDIRRASDVIDEEATQEQVATLHPLSAELYSSSPAPQPAHNFDTVNDAEAVTANAFSSAPVTAGISGQFCAPTTTQAQNTTQSGVQAAGETQPADAVAPMPKSSKRACDDADEEESTDRQSKRSRSNMYASSREVLADKLVPMSMPAAAPVPPVAPKITPATFKPGDLVLPPIPASAAPISASTPAVPSSSRKAPKRTLENMDEAESIDRPSKRARSGLDTFSQVEVMADTPVLAPIQRGSPSRSAAPASMPAVLGRGNLAIPSIPNPSVSSTVAASPSVPATPIPAPTPTPRPSPRDHPFDPPNLRPLTEYERKGMKTNCDPEPNYPRSSVDLPRDIGLVQQCREYPNHLTGKFLFRFIEAGWTARNLHAAVKDDVRQRVQGRSQPWQKWQKRLDDAKMEKKQFNVAHNHNTLDQYIHAKESGKLRQYYTAYPGQGRETSFIDDENRSTTPAPTSRHNVAKTSPDLLNLVASIMGKLRLQKELIMGKVLEQLYLQRVATVQADQKHHASTEALRRWLSGFNGWLREVSLDVPQNVEQSWHSTHFPLGVFNNPIMLLMHLARYEYRSQIGNSSQLSEAQLEFQEKVYVRQGIVQLLDEWLLYLQSTQFLQGSGHVRFPATRSFQTAVALAQRRAYQRPSFHQRLAGLNQTATDGTTAPPQRSLHTGSARTHISSEERLKTARIEANREIMAALRDIMVEMVRFVRTVPVWRHEKDVSKVEQEAFQQWYEAFHGWFQHEQLQIERQLPNARIQLVNHRDNTPYGPWYTAVATLAQFFDVKGPGRFGRPAGMNEETYEFEKTSTRGDYIVSILKFWQAHLESASAQRVPGILAFPSLRRPALSLDRSHHTLQGIQNLSSGPVSSASPLSGSLNAPVSRHSGSITYAMSPIQGIQPAPELQRSLNSASPAASSGQWSPGYPQGVPNRVSSTAHTGAGSGSNPVGDSAYVSAVTNSESGLTPNFSPTDSGSAASPIDLTDDIQGLSQPLHSTQQGATRPHRVVKVQKLFDNMPDMSVSPDVDLCDQNNWTVLFRNHPNHVFGDVARALAAADYTPENILEEFRLHHHDIGFTKTELKDMGPGCAIDKNDERLKKRRKLRDQLAGRLKAGKPSKPEVASSLGLKRKNEDARSQNGPRKRRAGTSVGDTPTTPALSSAAAPTYDGVRNGEGHNSYHSRIMDLQLKLHKHDEKVAILPDVQRKAICSELDDLARKAQEHRRALDPSIPQLPSAEESTLASVVRNTPAQKAHQSKDKDLVTQPDNTAESQPEPDAAFESAMFERGASPTNSEKELERQMNAQLGQADDQDDLESCSDSEADGLLNAETMQQEVNYDPSSPQEPEFTSQTELEHLWDEQTVQQEVNTVPNNAGDSESEESGEE